MTTMRIAHEEDEKRKKAVSKIGRELGYDIEIGKVEVGDYVIDDDSFCVEYKTAADYISSVQDGRLHCELTAMKEQYDNAYLVLVNDFKNCFFAGTSRGFNTDKIAGSIASTAARYGNVKIAPFETKPQSYKGIFKLHEKSLAGEKVENPIKCTQNRVNYEQPFKYMLLCLPNIGEKTANKIIDNTEDFFSFADHVKNNVDIGVKLRKETVDFIKKLY
jgi:ERCC4-type nuclease